MKTRALYKSKNAYSLVWFKSKGMKFPKKFYFYFTQSNKISEDNAFSQNKTYYIDSYGEVANPKKIPISSKRQYDVEDLNEEDFIVIYRNDGHTITPSTDPNFETVFIPSMTYYYDIRCKSQVTPNNLGLYDRISAIRVKYEDFEPSEIEGVKNQYINDEINLDLGDASFDFKSIKIYEKNQKETSFCELVYEITPQACSSEAVFNSDYSYYNKQGENFILKTPNSLNLYAIELTEDDYFESNKDYFDTIEGGTPLKPSNLKLVFVNQASQSESFVPNKEYLMEEKVNETYRVVRFKDLGLCEVGTTPNTYVYSSDANFIVGKTYYRIFAHSPKSLNLYKKDDDNNYVLAKEKDFFDGETVYYKDTNGTIATLATFGVPCYQYLDDKFEPISNSISPIPFNTYFGVEEASPYTLNLFVTSRPGATFVSNRTYFYKKEIVVSEGSIYSLELTFYYKTTPKDKNLYSYEISKDTKFITNKKYYNSSLAQQTPYSLGLYVNQFITDLNLIILNEENNFFSTYTKHISTDEDLVSNIIIPFKKFAVVDKFEGELINGNYSIKQRGVADNLIQRLSILKNELWWQINYGLPVLEKHKNKSIIDSVIINIVLSNRDVKNIIRFESKVENHIYKFSMIVDTVFDESISLSNEIKI